MHLLWRIYLLNDRVDAPVHSVGRTYKLHLLTYLPNYWHQTSHSSTSPPPSHAGLPATMHQGGPGEFHVGRACRPAARTKAMHMGCTTLRAATSQALRPGRRGPHVLEEDLSCVRS